MCGRGTAAVDTPELPIGAATSSGCYVTANARRSNSALNLRHGGGAAVTGRWGLRSPGGLSGDRYPNQPD